MYDLIIIGGGPAGMTAAIYAAREKLNTLLLTREFGGQMAKKEVEIENYPGFPSIAASELINKFHEHVKGLNVAIEVGEATEITKTDNGFTIKTAENVFESKTVLVTTGSDPRFLNVPGEKEFIGRGVGYCATCDGPLFGGRTVAVIGGGNSAFESAYFLTKFAKKVYVLEAGNMARASAEIKDKVAATGKAEVILNATVMAVKGEKFVKTLEYRDSVSGQIKELAVDGVFIKIGQTPASRIVANLAEINPAGEIVFDITTHRTKTDGLFVAGDVSAQKYKQVVIACGEGAKAVLSVAEYFRDKN